MKEILVTCSLNGKKERTGRENILRAHNIRKRIRICGEIYILFPATNLLALSDDIRRVQALDFPAYDEA
jgi:hypothetical protein